MKTWRGIANDVNAISDGAQMIRNASFYIGGELRRRSTLHVALTQAGSFGMATYGAPNGTQYVLLVSSAGAVSVVEAV